MTVERSAVCGRWRCPGCGSERTSVLYRFPPSRLIPVAAELLHEIRIFRCPNCELVFSSALDLPEEQIARFYDAEFFQSHAYWHDVDLARPQGSPDAALYATILDQLGDPQGRRLLDVGCGLGVFLATARARGWQIMGIDLSPYAVDLTRRGLGCPVHHGTLEDLPADYGTFDVICAWDLVEHVRDVNSLLTATSRRLSTGGQLVVRTINESSWLARLSGLVYWLTAGYAYHLVRRTHEVYHLYYFTPATLDGLLAKVGLATTWRQMHDIPVERLAMSRMSRPLMRLIYAGQRRTGACVEQLLIAERAAVR